MSTISDTTVDPDMTDVPAAAGRRPAPLPGSRVDHLGAHHGWGPVVAVHELGRYAIVEYLRDNTNWIPAGVGAATHGRSAFSATVDDRYIHRANDSLEEAIVSAIEFTAAGANCGLAALFHRAIAGTIPGERTSEFTENEENEENADGIPARAKLVYRAGAYTVFTLEGQWWVRTTRGATAARPTLERALVAGIALERGRPWAAEFFEAAAYGILAEDPVFDGEQVSQLALDAARFAKTPRVIESDVDELVGKPVTVAVMDGHRPTGQVLRGRLEHVEKIDERRAFGNARFGRVQLDEPLWNRTHVTVSMQHIRPAS